jgi:hypothetical protein
VSKKREAFIQAQNAPSTHSKQHYRDLVNKTKASVRADKNRWWRERAEDVQQAANQHKSKAFYHKLRQLNKKFSSTDLGHIKDKNGNLIEDEGAKLERWAEHFHDVFNVQGCVDGDLLSALPVPEAELPISSDEPSKAEVQVAIEQLNDSAPGLDRISARILKAGGAAMVEWLHRVILTVWRSGKCPADWKRAAIVALFKKGDKTVCDNYRGILTHSGENSAHDVRRRHGPPL